MSFEELLESFIGREIIGFEFGESEEMLVYLNDDAVMVVGADEDGDLYLKRLEPEVVN